MLFPFIQLDPSSAAAENQWNQVDDFKWLRPEQSPNWSLVPADERLGDNTWSDLVIPANEVRRKPSELLSAVGIPLQ